MGFGEGTKKRLVKAGKCAPIKILKPVRFEDESVLVGGSFQKTADVPGIEAGAFVFSLGYFHPNVVLAGRKVAQRDEHRIGGGTGTPVGSAQV